RAAPTSTGSQPYIAIVQAVAPAQAAATGEKQPVSIERQVRIAAGSLVLLGVIASVLIHPAAIVLSVFVASGLIFAGHPPVLCGPPRPVNDENALEPNDQDRWLWPRRRMLLLAIGLLIGAVLGLTGAGGSL
ncbi:MAG: hypothetical protein IPG06_24515, partial [Haliea sp.]|nr:hypothetical protein [Haliea sp.]